MTPAKFSKIRRIDLGMTQRQLAYELEVSESWVAAWEQGRRKIPKLADLALRYLLVFSPKQKEDEAYEPQKDQSQSGASDPSAVPEEPL